MPEQLTPEILAAAHDPTHPQHHYNLGKVLADLVADAALGIAAYQDPKVLLTPGAMQTIGGFMNRWFTRQPHLEVKVPDKSV